MEGFLLEIGIRALDFVQISAGFILTMLVFFSATAKKHVWLNYVLVVTFTLQCIFFILFHEGNVRFFAALMLLSTLIVECVVTLRRKLEVGQ